MNKITLIRFTKHIQYLLLFIILLGLLLNLFIKDLFWPLSGIFYLLPLKLLFAISIIYILISIKNRFHLLISLTLTISLLLYMSLPETGLIESEDASELICWNVARDATSSQDLAIFINEFGAEIYVFIEFDNVYKEAAEKNDLVDYLKDYDLYILSGNMAVVVKKRMEVVIIDSLTDSYNNFNVIQYNNLICVVVDIGSWPLYNRSKPFSMLNGLVEEYNVDIICGDFNTPYQSIYFDNFKNQFNCGITENLKGRENWPSCFPLVSLDHILVSKKFRINNYSIIRSYKSDHLPIQVNFE